MAKRPQDLHRAEVAADPNEWSEQSKHSVAFQFKRKYVDAPYKCWRCGATCIFKAEDQKYTFEVKKANINQRRNLCTACWQESHKLRAALSERDMRWAADKLALRSNRKFLSEWLDLLTRWNEFAPYRQDVAKINMLHGLLELE